MNFAAILHKQKSEMCYALDGEHLHLRIKTAKGEAVRVSVRAVDPYDWFPRKDDPSQYEFAAYRIRSYPMQLECETEYADVWSAVIGPFPFSRIRYGFVIETETERYLFGSHYAADLSQNESEQDNLWNYFNFPYLNEEDMVNAPDWVKDTVWYQIFPYSFSADGAPCSETRQGTLKGVTAKLDYIQSMGFNGIYFTPIFASPSAHKYDTRDYYSVDPSFGTNEDFEELVTEAHKRGIRIMLDAVFNHCGAEHPFWRDVVAHGKDSEYYDCFYILDQSKAPNDYVEIDGVRTINYRAFGFTTIMPKWNTSHPLVREHLLGAARYWIERYHIDGWRLDVSNEVSHDFWRAFRKTVREANPDLYILGENWDNSMPWLFGDQMDAVMNYEFLNPVWSFLGTAPLGKERKRDINAEQFKYGMNDMLTNYPVPVTKVMFNLLESHDTDRLMTVCGNNEKIAALAYVIQMTFPGSPSVYYGGEVGVDGAEHTNRASMDWETAQNGCALQAHLKRLTALRKSDRTFGSETISWLMTDNASGTVIYEKKDADKALHVIIHNRGDADEIALPEPLRNKTLADVYGNRTVTLNDRLTLGAYEFLLLEEANRKEQP